ncbi:uncharacterized protein BDR25DRAFT_359902 [Lindgomyces ingoldianus]|uniref:Uncharacterized protein n=1 Tax=Lindgomyces ingoldianus TaxID=673940 RepID=A0ACB6QGQ9_9PLEO|nr:uncharacterized protein BDR25DRAFT_359902 [Lindgomyces ingoldianus]KAF2466111.1 hypothetical protein BDR25DRAFT_359902 [Lindgomyces ingoldianus]
MIDLITCNHYHPTLFTVFDLVIRMLNFTDRHCITRTLLLGFIAYIPHLIYSNTIEFYSPPRADIHKLFLQYLFSPKVINDCPSVEDVYSITAERNLSLEICSFVPLLVCLPSQGGLFQRLGTRRDLLPLDAVEERTHGHAIQVIIDTAVGQSMNIREEFERSHATKEQSMKELASDPDGASREPNPTSREKYKPRSFTASRRPRKRKGRATGALSHDIVAKMVNDDVLTVDDVGIKYSGEEILILLDLPKRERDEDLVSAPGRDIMEMHAERTLRSIVYEEEEPKDPVHRSKLPKMMVGSTRVLTEDRKPAIEPVVGKDEQVPQEERRVKRSSNSYFDKQAFRGPEQIARSISRPPQ